MASIIFDVDVDVSKMEQKLDQSAVYVSQWAKQVEESTGTSIGSMYEQIYEEDSKYVQFLKNRINYLADFLRRYESMATEQQQQYAQTAQEFTEELIARKQDLVEETVKEQKAQEGANQATEQAAEVTEGYGKSLLGVAAVMAIVKAAVELFKAAINSTAQTTQWWARETAAGKAALQELLRAVALGDFSNLIRGMKEAADAAREYTRTMQYVDALRRQTSLDMLQIETQIQRQRELIANADKVNYAERIDLEQGLMRLLEAKQELQINGLRTVMQAELEAAAQTSGLSERDIEYAARHSAEMFRVADSFKTAGIDAITFGQALAGGVPGIEKYILQLVTGTTRQQQFAEAVRETINNSTNPEAEAILRVAFSYQTLGTEQQKRLETSMREYEQLGLQNQLETLSATDRINAIIRERDAATAAKAELLTLEERLKTEKEALNKAIIDGDALSAMAHGREIGRLQNEIAARQEMARVISDLQKYELEGIYRADEAYKGITVTMGNLSEAFRSMNKVFQEGNELVGFNAEALIERLAGTYLEAQRAYSLSMEAASLGEVDRAEELNRQHDELLTKYEAEKEYLEESLDIEIDIDEAVRDLLEKEEALRRTREESINSLHQIVVGFAELGGVSAELRPQIEGLFGIIGELSDRWKSWMNAGQGGFDFSGFEGATSAIMIAMQGISMIADMLPDKIDRLNQRIEAMNRAIEEQQRIISEVATREGTVVAANYEYLNMLEQQMHNQWMLQLELMGRGRMKQAYEALQEFFRLQTLYEQALIEYGDQIRGGITPNTIADAIREGFEQGKTSVDDFSSYINDVLKQALMNVFTQRILAQIAESGVMDYITQVMTDGVLSATDVVGIQQRVMNIVEVMRPIYDGMMVGLQAVQDGAAVSVEQVTQMNAVTAEIKAVAEQAAGAVQTVATAAESITQTVDSASMSAREAIENARMVDQMQIDAAETVGQIVEVGSSIVQAQAQNAGIINDVQQAVVSQGEAAVELSSLLAATNQNTAMTNEYSRASVDRLVNIESNTYNMVQGLQVMIQQLDLMATISARNVYSSGVTMY